MTQPPKSWPKGKPMPEAASPEPLPNTLEIKMFLHCGRCLGEMPGGESPRTWAQLEVGWTEAGLQVWCKRHECNVLHVDFEGHKHPANTTARPDA